MSKVFLLWQVKHKIIYQSFLVKITLCLVIGLITLFLISFWKTQSNTVQVLIVDQEKSTLGASFLQTKSERIRVKERDLESALTDLREYRAEAVIVIPKDAGQKIAAGQTQKILDIYYLKGNRLAPFLADRLISDAFASVYDLAASRFLAKLYHKYEVENQIQRKIAFEEAVETYRKERGSESYFKIKFTEPDKVDTGQEAIDFSDAKQGKLTETGILITAAGLNYIFLLYFGLKLLSERNKNDRIRIAGFREWHSLLSDGLVLLSSQLLLFLVLLFPAMYFGMLYFWGKMLATGWMAIFLNLLFIRWIKERQLYFPLGIGVYLLGVLVQLAVLS